MRLCVPARIRASDDAGFSLVEAVVALTIATVIFTALAMALIGGAKSALVAQQNQQAGDVLNQAVEDSRALPYASLVMRPADLNVGEATRAPSLSLAEKYNPTNDSTSGTGVEDLVTPDPNGGIVTHVEPVVQNGGTFTVRRYVTVPVDAAAVYKRLTVVVDWTTLGKKRTRTYSTLVADTKRGLPLPDFKFTNSSALSDCRNPGSVAVFAFNVRNNGARDSWNITGAPTSTSWSYYQDSSPAPSGNGIYDGGSDTALTVAAGAANTGLLEPTTSRTFFAVLQLPTAAVRPAPYTLTTVFRATSAAQPAYYQELSGTTTVVSGSCGTSPTTSPTASPTASPTTAPSGVPTQPAASCPSLTGAASTSAPGGTLVGYSLTNAASTGNTTARLDMPVLKGTAPAAGSLYNYSTDLHTAAGRRLSTATTATTGTAPALASWVYGMPAASTFTGDGQVTLWAAMADGSLTGQPKFQIQLDRLSSTGAFSATLSTVTYTTPTSGWACSGMRPFSVQLPSVGGGTRVAKNAKLRLSVTLISGGPVVLGYDTAAYPATMSLPFKSGVG